MDSVEIRELSCECIIGILARERRVPQRVVLDVEMRADLSRAGHSGRIAHTIDYARACNELHALLKFRRYALLEEAAEECAAWLFSAHPLIVELSLAIEKPGALAGRAAAGGVRIGRSRGEPARPTSTNFGSRSVVLETHEATIALLTVEPGRSLTAAALGVERALVLAPHGTLETAAQPIGAEARELAPEGARNASSAQVLLVSCALGRI